MCDTEREFFIKVLVTNNNKIVFVTLVPPVQCDQSYLTAIKGFNKNGHTFMNFGSIASDNFKEQL